MQLVFLDGTKETALLAFVTKAFTQSLSFKNELNLNLKAN